MLWHRWPTEALNSLRSKLRLARVKNSRAKQGRRAFRKNFSFNASWKGRYYDVKQVVPIVAEEPDAWVVITVYVFYFGGNS